MDWIQAIEVFALVTGVIYLVLEILQKNAMWVVGLLTSLACAISFAYQQVWASMALNIYYVVMSMVGFIQWRKAGTQVEQGAIHLSRLSGKTVLVSAVLFVVGSVVVIQLLRAAGDSVPQLDGIATVLSVIATWWLVKSYLQQWLLWIVADVFTTTLCILTGQYWMALLYVAYILSAIYGYFHWKKNGELVV